MKVNSIREAISTPSAMVVLGSGMLAANAMIAAGQSDAPVITVNPTSGEPGLATTPLQMASLQNPEAKNGIPSPAVARDIQQGINTPQMGMTR